MLRTALAGLLAAVCLSAAPPPKCTQIPVQWSVNNTYVDPLIASLVTNDGSAAYVNGQSGVSAVISTCGSNDAIITVSGARAIRFNFTDPLSTNSNTPDGLVGSTVNAASVNIRNVRYLYNATGDYGFTTRMGANLVNLGPFRMVNPASQAIPPQTDDPIANTPNATALVYVHHCPKSASPFGTCPALSHETWFVYPDLPLATGPARFAGSLILTVGNGKHATTVNAGQFSMPFNIAISRLDD